MTAVIKLSLPLGLLVLYVVGALLWYELLRAELVDVLRRRRGRQGRGGRRRRHNRRGKDSGESGPVAVADGDRPSRATEPGLPALAPVKTVRGEGDGAEPGMESAEPGLAAVDGVVVDDSRMHYYLARKAAAAERDAAVEAASEATRRAIERIEQRYGRAGSADDGPVRRAAKAERDAAVEAANAAAKQAIERIERRYREIDWALEDEEAERIRQILERAER
jgi:hypothetical protein